MMDLVDLRAFIRIAELRSVSAAARALDAPKSSISRSLARLEAAVGAVLVERSTRHLRLTDAGALLHPHALRILNDVDEAGNALNSFASEPRGTIRVNAPFTFAVGLLAPCFPASGRDIRTSASCSPSTTARSTCWPRKRTLSSGSAPSPNPG